MAATIIREFQESSVPAYDRKSEVKAFDETKAGVKGLVEAGVTKVPRMFHCRHPNRTDISAGKSNLNIPIIDLNGIHDCDSVQRTEVVSRIRNAGRKWGFFQVINHGIPTHVLDGIIDGIRRFHEQDAEVRKQFYNRDVGKKVFYMSNYSLFRDSAAYWRDTLGFFMAPHPPKLEDMPAVCRYVILLNFGINSLF